MTGCAARRWRPRSWRRRWWGWRPSPRCTSWSCWWAPRPRAWPSPSPRSWVRRQLPCRAVLCFGLEAHAHAHTCAAAAWRSGAAGLARQHQHCIGCPRHAAAITGGSLSCKFVLQHSLSCTGFDPVKLSVAVSEFMLHLARHPAFVTAIAEEPDYNEAILKVRLTTSTAPHLCHRHRSSYHCSGCSAAAGVQQARLCLPDVKEAPLT